MNTFDFDLFYNLIYDSLFEQEVIRLTRPFKCCAGCCWCANADCCAFTIDVESPVGTVIGQIRQSWDDLFKQNIKNLLRIESVFIRTCCFCRQSFWKPHYEILDETGQKVFRIVGPCCICHGICCTCDFPFDIFPLTGSVQQPIGSITKEWSGLAKEMCTDATNFSLTCRTMMMMFA